MYSSYGMFRRKKLIHEYQYSQNTVQGAILLQYCSEGKIFCFEILPKFYWFVAHQTFSVTILMWRPQCKISRKGTSSCAMETKLYTYILTGIERHVWKLCVIWSVLAKLQGKEVVWTLWFNLCWGNCKNLLH